MTAAEGGNGALVVTTGTRRYLVTDPQLLIMQAWQAVAYRSGADAPGRCLADTGQMSPQLAVSVLTVHMSGSEVARRAPEMGLRTLVADVGDAEGELSASAAPSETEGVSGWLRYRSAACMP